MVLVTQDQAKVCANRQGCERQIALYRLFRRLTAAADATWAVACLNRVKAPGFLPARFSRCLAAAQRKAKYYDLPRLVA